MAESNPIKSTDLIENGVFKNATDSAKELIPELEKMVEGFKAIASASAEVLKQNKNPQSSKDIKEATAAVVNHEKARRALAQTELQLSRLRQQEDKELTTRIKTNREQAKIIQQQQKDLDKLNGEYKKGVARLSELKKALKELTFTGKENTEAFKKMKVEFDELNKKIIATEQSVGEHHRNVGNYKSGFDGLAFSITQVGRELPSLAYGFGTFFGAISNNIPMVVDEIGKLKKANAAMNAEGKKTPSIFQSIIAATLSWQTVLSVGLTMLVVFSKEIIGFVKSIWETGDAFKYSNEQMEEHTSLVDKIVLRWRKARIESRFLNKEIDEATRDRLLLELEVSEETKEIDEDLKKERLELEKKYGVKIENERKKVATIALKNKVSELNLLKSLDEEFYKQQILRAKKAKDVAMSGAGGQPADAVLQGIESDIKRSEAALKEVQAVNTEIKKANSAYIDEYKLLVQAIEEEDRSRRKRQKKNREKDVAFNGKFVEAAENFHNQVEKATEDNAYKLLEIERDQQKDRLNQLREADLKALKESTLSEEEKAKERTRILNSWTQAQIDIIQKYYHDLAELRLKDFEKEKEELLSRRIERLELEAALTENQRKWLYSVREKERKEAFVAYQKELKDYKIKLDEKGKMTAESQAYLEGLEKKFQMALAEIRRQEQVELTQSIIQLSQQTLTATQQYLDIEYNMHKTALDRQIKLREDAINRQVELAKNGLDNQLAYEEKKLAKDEMRRRDMERKQARQREAIQLAQAYLNAYNAELQKQGADPSTAGERALKNVLIARGLGKTLSSLAEYYEGTEDTGKAGQALDSKGGRLAILHDNERVLTKNQNKMVGDLKNDELAALAWKYQKGLMVDLPKERSFAKNMAGDFQNMLMVNYLKEIAEKPVQQVEVDKLGNFIETIYEKGRKDVIIHKSKTRI